MRTWSRCPDSNLASLQGRSAVVNPSPPEHRHALHVDDVDITVAGRFVGNVGEGESIGGGLAPRPSRGGRSLGRAPN